MELEDRLKRLSGYNVSFEIKQGYYHIALVYKDGWNILDSESDDIYIQEKNGVHHYIGKTDSVRLDDIFKCIDATIDYNLDLERKLLLFKEKTAELQELFSKEDYDTLKTIEFKVSKKEEKKKTRKGKKDEKSAASKGKKKKTVVKDKPAKKDEVAASETKVGGIVQEDIVKETPVGYDENDEIVTMDNTYFEELERQ